MCTLRRVATLLRRVPWLRTLREIATLSSLWGLTLTLRIARCGAVRITALLRGLTALRRGIATGSTLRGIAARSGSTLRRVATGSTLRRIPTGLACGRLGLLCSALRRIATGSTLREIATRLTGSTLLGIATRSVSTLRRIATGTRVS